MHDMRHLIDLTEAWTRPDPGEEHDEVGYQLGSDREEQFLPDHVRDYLETISDPLAFRTAIQNGKIVNVTPREARTIGNTGDRWQNSNWQPDKKTRVAKLFQAGKTITTPIVLHHKQSGEKWLLAGHHRLTYNSQIEAKPTPALHLAY